MDGNNGWKRYFPCQAHKFPPMQYVLSQPLDRKVILVRAEAKHAKVMVHVERFLRLTENLPMTPTFHAQTYTSWSWNNINPFLPVEGYIVITGIAEKQPEQKLLY